MTKAPMNRAAVLSGLIGVFAAFCFYIYGIIRPLFDLTPYPFAPYVSFALGTLALFVGIVALIGKNRGRGLFFAWIGILIGLTLDVLFILVIVA